MTFNLKFIMLVVAVFVVNLIAISKESDSKDANNGICPAGVTCPVSLKGECDIGIFFGCRLQDNKLCCSDAVSEYIFRLSLHECCRISNRPKTTPCPHANTTIAPTTTGPTTTGPTTTGPTTSSNTTTTATSTTRVQDPPCEEFRSCVNEPKKLCYSNANCTVPEEKCCSRVKTGLPSLGCCMKLTPERWKKCC